MKTAKRVLVKRNPYVSLAILRKAGAHRKPFKATRGAQNRGVLADS
jgi:hypothetical protein